MVRLLRVRSACLKRALLEVHLRWDVSKRGGPRILLDRRVRLTHGPDTRVTFLLLLLTLDHIDIPLVVRSSRRSLLRGSNLRSQCEFLLAISFRLLLLSISHLHRVAPE